jgi:hypothetical protein
MWTRFDVWIIALLKAPPEISSSTGTPPVLLNGRRKSTISAITKSSGSDKILLRQVDRVDIASLEKAAKDTFTDIVNMHELRLQIKRSGTFFGRWLWRFGFIMSGVAVLRLLQALYNVSCSMLDLECTSDANVVGGVSDVEHLLESFNRHVSLNLTNWSSALNIVFICALGLMQIRAFLGTMRQMAKLGILSTNTELYALVLAYLSGFYFLASIILIRTHLPLEYRKGVTVALGPFEFGFFSWLFDCVFVLSTTTSLLYLMKQYTIQRRV